MKELIKTWLVSANWFDIKVEVIKTHPNRYEIVIRELNEKYESSPKISWVIFFRGCVDVRIYTDSDWDEWTMEFRDELFFTMVDIMKETIWFVINKYNNNRYEDEISIYPNKPTTNFLNRSNL